jgi:hypothetical protein
MVFANLSFGIDDDIVTDDDMKNIPQEATMTKIANTPHLSGVDHQRPKISSGPNPTGFQKVFDDLLQNQTQGVTAPSTSAHAINPTFLTANAIETLPLKTGLQAMERLIDSLDAYQQRLADPDCSLRDLEPVLGRLEKAHRQLSDVSEKTSAESPLQDIINEGLVTATMEISRFRSGIYC